jgi:hypothetical protein
MKNILFKFNWRLIIIHFFSIWLIMIAFRLLSFLYDYAFIINLADHYDEIKHFNFKSFGENGDIRLSDDLLRIETFCLIGMLVGFILSLGISLRMRLFWMNSFLSFLITFILHSFRIIGERDAPYYYFGIKNIFWVNSIFGIFALTLGLLLLFSKRSKRFINEGMISRNKLIMPIE